MGDGERAGWRRAEVGIGEEVGVVEELELEAAAFVVAAGGLAPPSPAGVMARRRAARYLGGVGAAASVPDAVAVHVRATTREWPCR